MKGGDIMKITDCIKLGFGFYIGYELAKNLDDIFGTVYKMLKERVNNGTC